MYGQKVRKIGDGDEIKHTETQKSKDTSKEVGSWTLAYT